MSESPLLHGWTVGAHHDSREVPVLTKLLARRLTRTGVVSGTDVVTQDNFDAAYEADIEAIVRRVLSEEDT